MDVTVRNVVFQYGEGAFRLDIPELNVPSGQTLALLGPSGCGKTTFLNLLSGLFRPQIGEVTVGDQTVSAMSEGERRRFRARHIGYVFQDFGLLDYLTARDNILYPMRVSGQKIDGETRARVTDLAVTVGIGHVLNQKPAHMSQGEKQRTAICRSVLAQADLLLADEPTGNLDPASKAAVLDQLFDRAAETGATLIAVTHDQGVTDRFDRALDFADFLQEAA